MDETPTKGSDDGSNRTTAAAADMGMMMPEPGELRPVLPKLEEKKTPRFRFAQGILPI